MTTDTMLTRDAAALEAAVNVRTIDRLIASGQLPAYRVGSRSVRIKRSDLACIMQPIPIATAGRAVARHG